MRPLAFREGTSRSLLAACAVTMRKDFQADAGMKDELGPACTRAGPFLASRGGLLDPGFPAIFVLGDPVGDNIVDLLAIKIDG